MTVTTRDPARDGPAQFFATLLRHRPTFAQLLRELDGSDDVQRGAGTHVQPLGVQQFVHHCDRLFVGDVERAVQAIDERAQVGSHASLANP